VDGGSCLTKTAGPRSVAGTPLVSGGQAKVAFPEYTLRSLLPALVFAGIANLQPSSVRVPPLLIAPPAGAPPQSLLVV
jgi:hypothetical protein